MTRAVDGIQGLRVGKTQTMIEIFSLDLFYMLQECQYAAWDAYDEDNPDVYTSAIVSRDMALVDVSETDRYMPPRWEEHERDWEDFKALVTAAKADGIQMIVVRW